MYCDTTAGLSPFAGTIPEMTRAGHLSEHTSRDIPVKPRTERRDTANSQ